MDNKSLIKLGEIYLSRNLLEPAIRVLSRIPESDEYYCAAKEKLVRAYYQIGDFGNVIRVAEELLSKDVKKACSVPAIIGYLSTAYSHEGKKKLAKKYIVESFSCFPTNKQIADRLRKLTPGSEHPMMDRLYEELPFAGLTPHVLFDCIAPLLHNARPVTCCFLDQMDDAVFDFHHNTLLGGTEVLFKRFGIYTAVLRYAQGSVGLIKLFFSLRPTLLQEVSELEELGWREFIENSDENPPSTHMREKEGMLLGYPQCCVKWASELRRIHRSIEVEALADLIAEEYICSTEGAQRPGPEFAYFGFEFYPCQARCSAAEDIGKHMLETYLKFDPQFIEIFRHYILSLNYAKIYDVPTSNYKYFLDKFNSSYSETIEDCSIEDNAELAKS